LHFGQIATCRRIFTDGAGAIELPFAIFELRRRLLAGSDHAQVDY
jgi:hypothetical protein